MPDDRLLELIPATSEILGLDIPVIEKDYYVTQIIHALSQAENDYFRLVFCGGTCLAKAHRVVGRMSEDVDFKIQLKTTDSHFSKTQVLKELKTFRSSIKSLLMLPDLIISEPVVRNEGRYLRIEINYPSAFSGNQQLRPHVLAEFNVSDIHLPATSLSVRTLIEETLENITLSDPSPTPCVSINETAIEKWVALTRKIIAIERNYYSDDETLVRHIYDLDRIQSANQINADFSRLARIIINTDAKQFGNQHPEYSANPIDEIRQSLDVLKSEPKWKKRYEEFIEVMVFDNTNTPNYESALATIQHLSKEII